VEFGEPKSEKSRRVLPLSDFAVEVLKRHRMRQKAERLKARGDWRSMNLVFTSTIATPVDDRNLRREFKAILGDAELGHLKIQELRHTCASLLLAQNAHPKVVQELLGHSQITVTLDTYSHLIPGLAQEAAQKIDAVLTVDALPNPVGVSQGVKQTEVETNPAKTA
jgi:integrase